MFTFTQVGQPNQEIRHLYILEHKCIFWTVTYREIVLINTWLINQLVKCFIKVVPLFESSTIYLYLCAIWLLLMYTLGPMGCEGEASK